MQEKPTHLEIRWPAPLKGRAQTPLKGGEWIQIAVIDSSRQVLINCLAVTHIEICHDTITVFVTIGNRYARYKTPADSEGAKRLLKFAGWEAGDI